MKKVLITICAVVALMACTKTEVAFDEPNEIAFAPVSKFETKATAEGTNFTADQNFYVFANTVASGTDASVAYFNNVLFKNTNGGNVYTGEPAQYWPNEKTLKFAGVTASGNIDGTTVAAAMTAWGTMTVSGYQQPTPSDSEKKNNDLMYFFDEGTDNAGYGKPTAEDTYVTPTMKHACSWIVVEVKLDSKLSNYWQEVKVTSVQFESLYTAGDVTFTNNAATWATTGTAVTDVSIFSGSTAINASTATKLETVENNTVVIPQTPTTLALNISYTTPAGGSVTETIDNISLDYDGAAATAWAPGKKYTYTLTIGADEIKIAPKSEDWTSGTGSGLAQEVK